MRSADHVEFVINLQLFAEDGQERNLPATPRRRQQARERGQVFRSGELSAAVLLLAGTATLYLAGSRIAAWVFSLFRTAVIDWSTEPLSVDAALALGRFIVVDMAWALLPLLAVLVCIGVAVNAAQVGLLFTLHPLSPKLSRINPLEGLKRIFSKRSLFEFGKGIVKIALITGLSIGVLRSAFVAAMTGMGEAVPRLTTVFGGYVWQLLWIAGAALVAVAALDYAYQRYEYERNLRMSLQEVKDEHRQTEGDPLLRSRIRQRQREMVQARMFRDLAESDVVVTNPTHLAVALRYDPQTMAAPVVTAKGAGHLALRIREAARAYGIVWVQDKFLARALYRQVDIGEQVPESLYQAVAEVLAFVWRLRGRRISELEA